MPRAFRIGFRKEPLVVLLFVLLSRPARGILLLALGGCQLVATSAGAACPLLDRIDQSVSYQAALPEHPRWGPCSIREHTVVWHPQRKKFYLLADVVPLASKHHPNTYRTGIHLWSSSDLRRWRYHGMAVPGENALGISTFMERPRRPERFSGRGGSSFPTAPAAPNASHGEASCWRFLMPIRSGSLGRSCPCQ